MKPELLALLCSEAERAGGGLGPTATVEEIARLQALTPVPLPPDLLDFYRYIGGLRGNSGLQDAVLHTPADLLAAAALPAGQWDTLRSLGLVDMILWSWGNDRFEFDPASGEGLKQQHVDTLNANYAAFGWRVLEDGEAFEYLYFDRQGRFGRVFYHQDAFGEVVEDHLRPMLKLRPAPADFDTTIREFMAAASGPSFPD